MNDDLIDRLAADLSPTPTRRPARVIGPALVVGGLCSLILLWGIEGLRSDLATAVLGPGLWFNLGMCAALSLCIAPMIDRLAVAGGRVGLWPLAGLALLAPLVVHAGFEIATAAPDARLALWLQGPWLRCPLTVMALSLPILTALVVRLRALSPVDLGRAGLVAGLLSGAIGAGLYSLTCNVANAVFFSSWYLLGIGLSGLVGRLAGPSLLRW